MTGITDPAQQYFKDGLWAWVTDQWKKLVADASSFLQVNVAAQDIDVEVKQQEPADLTPGIHGWDGSDWRKLALLWGYSDRLITQKDDTIVAGTTLIQDHTACADGEVWRILGFSLTNDTAACTCVIFANYGGTNYAVSGPHTITGAVYTVVSPFDLVLKKDDYIKFSWAAVAAGERCLSNVWGYKMKVAE